MSKQYDDPRFGVEQCFTTDVSASLASTVAATEINRYYIKKDSVLTGVQLRCKTGGTDAVRQVLVGRSLAGTGAFSGLGTVVLGTQANSTIKAMTITQGTFAAGDHIVMQHLGTGAEPWVVSAQYFYTETFVNA
jgi:hypothetical protein